MKTSKEQKLRLLKAKIAVALQDETGKVPTKEKIEEVFLLTRVMYKAVLGLHLKDPLILYSSRPDDHLP
jgi:hypothetical protein